MTRAGFQGLANEPVLRRAHDQSDDLIFALAHNEMHRRAQRILHVTPGALDAVGSQFTSGNETNASRVGFNQSRMTVRSGDRSPPPGRPLAVRHRNPSLSHQFPPNHDSATQERRSACESDLLSTRT